MLVTLVSFTIKLKVVVKVMGIILLYGFFLDTAHCKNKNYEKYAMFFRLGLSPSSSKGNDCI
jgi:hypothetical protein